MDKEQLVEWWKDQLLEDDASWPVGGAWWYAGIEEEHEDLDTRAAIKEALYCLPPRELRVIWGRFWGNETLKDTGQQLGVSRERVRQIEFTALRRMLPYFKKLNPKASLTALVRCRRCGEVIEMSRYKAAALRVNNRDRGGSPHLCCRTLISCKGIYGFKRAKEDG